MKEFFGFGGYQRPVEGFMSWQHILFVSILVVIMVILAITFGKIYKNKDEKSKNKVLIIAAILIDAFEIEDSYIDTNTSMIITQVYDHFIASNVKLRLMECYDYDQEVCIVNGAGVKNLESKKYVPLHELDRPENLFNYLTSVYIPKSSKKMVSLYLFIYYIVKC